MPAGDQFQIAFRDSEVQISDQVIKTMDLCLKEMEKQGLSASITLYVRDPSKPKDNLPIGDWSIGKGTTKYFSFAYDGLIEREFFNGDLV